MKPLDEKQLRISQERIQRAWDDLRKHTLIGPLAARAKLKILAYQPQVPAMFTTVGSSGEVFANTFNHPRTVEEWKFVQAHALLHLAFGHVKHAARGIVWNIACDCVVNEFLNRMRIGLQPEGLLRLPAGMPNDEEKLFSIWSRNGLAPKGGTTNGNAADMVLSGAAKANWADIFARAVRRAAKEALTSAAGESAPLGPAQQARAWFVNHYPLLGAVLQHFKIVEDARLCERLNVRIAALNSSRKQILINPGWAMSDAENRFVLAHMALHAGLQHAGRCGARDPFIWSCACDYSINAWLPKMTFLRGNCKAPADGTLFSEQYAELNTAAIYDELLKNPKAARKLATFAGEEVSDLLDVGSSSGRVLLDALLRGYQIHTESSRGELPHSLIDEIRALEQPPLPWDVRLAQWFDRHIPPIERIRTYARPSRRQSATPHIARPRYVLPDEEIVQRGTFGLIVDTSGALPAKLLAEVLGAISMYALSRNIHRVRVIGSGAELHDRGPLAADEIPLQIFSSPRSSAQIQPAVELLENARDFPSEAPLLIVTGTPCDRVKTPRTHAFVVPDGSRLPFQSDAEIVEVA